jgi:transcription antitermination protein NusB
VDVDKVTNLPDFGPDDEVVSEVIEHEKITTDRSIARRIALQVLYEVDCTNHEAEGVIEEHLQTPDASKKAIRYMRRLVRGVLDNRSQLDGIIQRYAPEWPLDQVAFVDRNILRIATYEMVFIPRIPIGVAIDEAVSLANLFGGDSALRFINGVLGTLADNIDDIRASQAPSGDEQEQT